MYVQIASTTKRASSLEIDEIARRYTWTPLDMRPFIIEAIPL